MLLHRSSGWDLYFLRRIFAKPDFHSSRFHKEGWSHLPALKQNLFYMTHLIPNILLSLRATKSQRSRGHHKFASGSKTSCSMVLNLLQKVLSNLTWLWSALHLNCQCDNANVFSYYCISALGKSK